VVWITRESSEGGGEFAKQALRWPTPDATQRNTCAPRKDTNFNLDFQEGRHSINLGQVVNLWMTPNVPNGGRHLSETEVEDKGQTDNGKRQVGLESQTKYWMTPRASMADNGTDSASRTRQLQGPNPGLK
jgi:hypothetical protein